MFRYLVNKNKKYFFVGFGLLILFSLERPILARLVIYNTDLAKGKLDFSWLNLFVPNILYLVFYFITNYYSELFLDKFEIKSRHGLNCDIYRSLIKNQRTMKKSEISTIFTNDIAIICGDYLKALVSVVYLLISFLGSAMLIFSINIKILLYLLLISFVTLYLQRKIAKKMEDQQLIFNRKVSDIVNIVNETFSSIGQIRIYKLDEKFNRKFEKRSKKATDKLYNLSVSEDLVEVVNQFSATLIEVGLYVLGVVLIIKSELSVQELLGLVVTTATITYPIYSFSRTSAKFSKTKKIREKLMAIIDWKDTENIAKEKIEKIENIKIKAYQGKYEDKFVNKELDFDINKGEKVLIQGENGAGKSTFLLSLLGFHENYGGEILYNNLDIGKITKGSLWDNISYVSQKNLVFEENLRDNIILDKKFDKEK